MTRVPFAAACVAGFVAVAALLAWPLRQGVPYLDDWLFFALARHLDSPGLLFLQDAVGVFFFRPLGLFAWWLSGRAFGGSAPAQYALNMALQAGCGAALMVLALSLGVRRSVAVAVGLLYAAHPAAVAAAAWLSDRFDLLATGFGLLGLAATQHAMRRFSALRAIGVCALVLAALASKEIAYAIVPAAILVALWPGGGSTATPRQRAVLIVAIGACAAFMLGLRPLLLRSGTESVWLQGGVFATFGGAFAKALHQLPSVIVVRFGNPLAVFVWGAGLATFAVAFIATRAWSRFRPHGRVAALGLVLVALAVFVEAPVLNASQLVPFAGDVLRSENITGMRFFHLPLAGLVLAAAAGVEAIAKASAQPRFPWRPLAAAAMLAGLLVTSRAVLRAYMDPSAPARREALVADAALAAIHAGGTFNAPCKLYFLGTGAAGGGFRGYADVAVKAQLPRGHSALHCFVLSEQAPWYNVLVDTPPPRAGQEPLATMSFAQRPYPPLALGNLTYYYVDVPNSAEIRSDPSARFFDWRDGRFVEVTAEVRSGARPVAFVNARPPA